MCTTTSPQRSLRGGTLQHPYLFLHRHTCVRKSGRSKARQALWVACLLARQTGDGRSTCPVRTPAVHISTHCAVRRDHLASTTSAYEAFLDFRDSRGAPLNAAGHTPVRVHDMATLDDPSRSPSPTKVTPELSKRRQTLKTTLDSQKRH